MKIIFVFSRLKFLKYKYNRRDLKKLGTFFKSLILNIRQGYE